jgi:predicted GTPase
VLVVEDGPTITHGGMPHGAGYRAAIDGGATVVDPRPGATPRLREVLARYPHIGPVLPALGYDREELDDLAAMIARADADLVLSATPADLGRLISLTKPVLRVRYEYVDAPGHDLAGRIIGWLRERGD